MTKILLANISLNTSQLQVAMTDELYATEKTLQLVTQGKTFRDAYQQVGKTFIKDIDQ